MLTLEIFQKWKLNALEMVNWIIRDNPKTLITFELQTKWYTGSSWFLQCISDDYYQGNLCIIYVEHDYTNIHCPIKSLWVVDYMQESFQVRENNGRIIYQFRVDGKTVLAKDEDIILLARDVSPAKLFGKRSKAIMQTLNVINTSYQGVEKAIKNASFIRFLLASPTVLTTDVKKNVQKILQIVF